MKLMQGRLLPWSFILMATLLLAACTSDSTIPQPLASSASGSVKQVRTASGPVAPAFAVSTGQETVFSLSDHQGDVVVLYFSFPG